ncbi:MAG: hypothetical protein PHN74_00460 [Candidatus Pacebacteria bacterium]|nr:hypothetical protein [Candidatus Paceibacterota bacterium]
MGSERRCLLCNGKLETGAKDYVCSKCGQRYDITEYVEASLDEEVKKNYIRELKKQRKATEAEEKKKAKEGMGQQKETEKVAENNLPEKKEKEEVKVMAKKKEVCIICDEKKIIIAKGCCAADYTLLNKMGGDVEKAKAYRLENPIGKKGRKAVKTAGEQHPPLPPHHSHPPAPETPPAFSIVASVKTMTVQVEYKMNVGEAKMETKILGVKIE